MIREARGEELEALRDLEQAAGERFRAVGLAHVAEGPPLSAEVLRAAQRRGDLWVYEAEGRPVGFAMTSTVEGDGYLDEVSVHPSFGGRGIGGQLLAHVCERARAAGRRRIWLATFRDVPWNAPFYARRGFVDVAEDELGPALRAKVAGDAARGLGAGRVVMCRTLARPDDSPG